jgi:hypothetical protein
MEEKIAKLPSWVRQHIKTLELRAQPNMEELSRLRRELEKQRSVIRRQDDRITAMVSMFQCAAKGGNEIAIAVQKIVEDYLIDDAE